jgi:hypothetical protein
MRQLMNTARRKSWVKKKVIELKTIELSTVSIMNLKVSEREEKTTAVGVYNTECIYSNNISNTLAGEGYCTQNGHLEMKHVRVHEPAPPRSHHNRRTRCRKRISAQQMLH